MIARLIRRFARDERGVFAVIFGLMAIVLVAMGGAAVDYIQVDQVRSRSQIALDAAALALQPQIYTKNHDQLKTMAQALLSERITDPNVDVTIDGVDTDKEDGQLYLRAEITVPMAFVSLVGIDEMTTHIVSQVTRKKLFIEASFVLDNSGSMGGTKITKLKEAAINAINILFYGTKSPSAGAIKAPNTRVAVVPFAYFVNAGADLKDQFWVDKDGKSSIATDNLDDDDDDSDKHLTQINRIALMESLAGTDYDWKGCFETRPYPYSVDDTPPTSANPDTLFVPEFAPDEPGDAGKPDNGFNNSYVDDNPSSCDIKATCTCTQTTHSYSCWKGWYWGTCHHTSTSCTAPDPSGGTRSCSCPSGYSTCEASLSVSGLSNRELQERTCKYEGATVKFSYERHWRDNGYIHELYSQGPNAGCPNADIQPLTDNVTTLTTKINAMVADGGTNIHEGTAWGLRTLSPGEPFTEGRDYGTATSKVLIIMTDGENTYWHVNRRYYGGETPNMNGTYYYMPYGYQYNGRLTMHEDNNYQNSDGDRLQLKMNDLTLEACKNAKDAGITIYTIGLQSPNQTTTNMLTECASERSKAYFPTQASQLDDVFSSIAEQLSQLRIER